MDSATQQDLNSNEVIVYSDQDDEQSVLNMLHNHSFKRGGLSLITQHVDKSSVVIAEPLRERLNPEESNRIGRDEYLKQIESLEERLQKLHQ